MRLRPATSHDAQLATALAIKVDLAELGEADYSEGDLRDEWGELDLARDTRIVEDDAGTPIAYAHFRGGDLMVCVDPDHHAKGAGTALANWGEARAVDRGLTTLRQAIGDRAHAARALLEARGYRRARSYWRMERDTSAHDTDDAFRPVTPTDAEALYVLNEAAFARNADYEPRPQDEWVRRVFGGHDVDLTRSRYAEGRGFALVRRWDDDTLYVPVLAVHPDHQGRGLGGQLLSAVFAAAGGRKVTLNVASDNPNAVKLYERVGMRQAWRVDDYQKALPD